MMSKPESAEMAARLPQNQRPAVKVILVGNSGVGKTCLIAAFYKQSFDFNMTANVSPAYSYSDVRNSKGVNVRLQIWDTAGQEKYLAVNQLFFRDSDVALVCFEAGDLSSLDAATDWVKRVKDEVPTCELIFVLTKSDLKTKEEIETLKKQIDSVIGQYNPKTLYVTSSLTKEGVNDVFNAAADAYKPKAGHPPHGTEISKGKKDQKEGCCK